MVGWRNSIKYSMNGKEDIAKDLHLNDYITSLSILLIPKALRKCVWGILQNYIFWKKFEKQVGRGVDLALKHQGYNQGN